MSVFSSYSTSTIINTLNDLFYMIVKLSTCLVFRETETERERGEKCVKEIYLLGTVFLERVLPCLVQTSEIKYETSRSLKPNSYHIDNQRMFKRVCTSPQSNESQYTKVKLDAHE